MKLKYKAVGSRYWRPGDDYVTSILSSLRRLLRDGDVVVVSEKAVATAKGNIIDEDSVKPQSLRLSSFTILDACFLGRSSRAFMPIQEEDLGTIEELSLR